MMENENGNMCVLSSGYVDQNLGHPDQPGAGTLGGGLFTLMPHGSMSKLCYITSAEIFNSIFTYFLAWSRVSVTMRMCQCHMCIEFKAL